MLWGLCYLKTLTFNLSFVSKFSFLGCLKTLFFPFVVGSTKASSLRAKFENMARAEEEEARKRADEERAKRIAREQKEKEVAKKDEEVCC